MEREIKLQLFVREIKHTERESHQVIFYSEGDLSRESEWGRKRCGDL